MPRASHASIDNLALPQRTVLVAAHIRNRADLAVKLEYGDTFTAQRHNCRTLVRNAFHRAGVNKSFANWIQFFPINQSLSPARGEMQAQNGYESGASCNRQQRASLRL